MMEFSLPFFSELLWTVVGGRRVARVVVAVVRQRWRLAARVCGRKAIDRADRDSTLRARSAVRCRDRRLGLTLLQRRQPLVRLLQLLRHVLPPRRNRC